MARAPFQHVRKGDALSFRADDYNAWQDAGKRASQRRTGMTPRQKQGRNIVVNVQNDTGAAIGNHSVLKIDGLVTEPADNEHILETGPIVSGATPDGNDNHICIALKPLADGAVGPAVVIGVVPCTVDIQTEGDAYARPIVDDDSQMESASQGLARIVYAPSGTGAKECLVQIPIDGGGGSGGHVLFGHFPDALAVYDGEVDYYPENSYGKALVPTVFTMAPVVPSSFNNWFNNHRERGVGEYESDEINFAVDATDTDDSIDLYIVAEKLDGSTREVWKGLVGSLTKETAGGYSENWYWKGGIEIDDGGFSADVQWIDNWECGYIQETIVDVDTAADFFQIDYDYTAELAAGNGTIYVVGGANEGTYTVASYSYSDVDDETTIYVEEEIPSAVVAGTLHAAGKLLFKYEEFYFDELPSDDNSQVDVMATGDGRWAYYPYILQSYVKKTSAGDSPQYPVRILESLPVNPDEEYLAWEHIAPDRIPKGCYILEYANEGQNSLRIRYRHHTTGDMYHLVIEREAVAGSSVEPLRFYCVANWGPGEYIELCARFEDAAGDMSQFLWDTITVYSEPP